MKMFGAERLLKIAAVGTRLLMERPILTWFIAWLFILPLGWTAMAVASVVSFIRKGKSSLELMKAVRVMASKSFFGLFLCAPWQMKNRIPAVDYSEDELTAVNMMVASEWMTAPDGPKVEL